MRDGEAMKEYIARVKSLANDLRDHKVEVSDTEICRRILNGLPSPYAPEKRNFAMRTDYSLADLEGGLVRVENFSKRSDGADGSHALAAGFKARASGQAGEDPGVVGGVAATEVGAAADVVSATVRVARH